MNSKSIDGLQRRSGNSAATNKTTSKKSVAPKTIPKKTLSETRRINVAASKNLGIPDNKKDLKALISENDDLEAKNKEDNHKSAVKEFLEEVKDSDPTDLAEIPKKERRKEKKMKKEKGRKKKHKVLKRVILIIFLLLIAGVVAAYFYFNDFVAKITDDGNLLALIFSDPDTPLKQDSNGRTNIIIFGTEGYNMDDPNYAGGYLTDSMMLLSINQETGDAKAVSLPRDLKASYTCTGTGKLNEVYFCEYSKNNKTEESRKEYEARAGQKVAEAFSEVLGVEVHYRIHANWAAVQSIVNAIGGIDVVFTTKGQIWEGDEVTIETTSNKGLRDLDSRGKIYLDYPNGQVVHLDGEKALAVARVRNAFGGYGASSGNFNREVFQQRILEAIIKKAKATNLTSDLFKVLEIKGAIGDCLRTDFKDVEIKTALRVASNVDMTNLESISLYSTDDKPAALMRTGMINGISYVLPTAGVGNYSAIHAYIKRKFSAEIYASETAQLVVLNGTNANGIANKEKAALEEKDYIVKSTGNAPIDQKGFDGVRIYQKNPKLTKTADALKAFYGVNDNDRTFSTEIPDSLKNTEADFIIVVGNGFSH